MPLYEYRCKNCGHQFEKIQSFSAPEEKECPVCHGELEKLLSAPAIQFKGSGWYVNDYASKGGSKGGSMKASADGNSAGYGVSVGDIQDTIGHFMTEAATLQRADWIRLEAASGTLSCNLVVLTGDGRVSLATFLHYDRRRGRALWPPLSAVHRRLVPGVLRNAAARAARPSPVPG